MIWSVKSGGDGTDITFSYAVGGYVEEGFDGLSKAADRVLGEQLDRLKKFVDGA